MARKVAPVEGVYQREGSDSWYARYWQNGKKVRKSFGRDRDAAIAYLEKARLLKRTGEGEVPTTAKRPVLTFAEMREEVSGVTVADLCDLMLKHIENNPKKYKDQENPPRRIGQIKKQFGSRIASGVKAHEIADWLETIDRAPATRNRLKTTFSGIYRYGVRRGKVEVNPARDVPSERVGEGVIRSLSDKEEERLRKVLQGDVDACGPTKPTLKEKAQHHIYELDIALGAGLRRGEQYNLPWPEVDFEEKKIDVKNTKNGTDRVVYMNEDVYRAFWGLKKLSLHRKRRASDKPNKSASDVVFALADNKKWFASALKRARIKDFRWHDCRHTFCTRLADNGASAYIIMKAAGHKSIQTSARYVHLKEETMRTAMEGLNQKKA
jgi:site-specific recombinase XerD